MSDMVHRRGMLTSVIRAVGEPKFEGIVDINKRKNRKRKRTENRCSFKYRLISCWKRWQDESADFI